MQRQRGVALITALLIVALATTIAVSMASRQHYDIRRTGNLMEAEQGWLYVQGLEGWASQILRRDQEQNNTDHPGDDWATPLPPIPVDGGQVGGNIEDLQGRFNLNNLRRQDGATDEDALRQFQRLLQSLSLSPELAMTLADWLDADLEPGFPGGAEDNTYLLLEPPYRAANMAMVSVTELRLLQGMDNEIFATLAPHVSALPGRVPINVNTATAPVLMSLHDEISEPIAEQLAADRGEQGYPTIDAFLQHTALAGLTIKPQSVSVSSHYFMATSQVQFGRIFLTYQSLLHRETNGRVQVIRRAQGNL